MIGHAVGVATHVDEHAVIDGDGQAVSSGAQRAQLVAMRRGEAELRTEPDAVEPQRCSPVSPLEFKSELLARELCWHVNLALEPSSTHIRAIGLKPERHLDIARCAVRGVARVCEELMIGNQADPRGLEADLIAEALGLQGTREGDLVGALLCGEIGVEPGLAFADVAAIKGQGPLSAQVQAGRRAGWGHGRRAKGRSRGGAHGGSSR